MTQEIPATLRWASPVVCAEGNHVVADTHWSSDRQGSYSRKDARCEDATGREVGANVHPKILALYYVPLLLAWAAALAWFFRKRPGDIDPPHA